MPTCCAPGCNRTEKTSPTSSFFKLPWHQPQKLKFWLGKLRLVHTPAKNGRICQYHFEDKFIVDDQKHRIAPHLYKRRITLSPDAYPSIFAHVEEAKQRKCSLTRQKNRQESERLENLDMIITGHEKLVNEVIPEAELPVDVKSVHVPSTPYTNQANDMHVQNSSLPIMATQTMPQPVNHRQLCLQVKNRNPKKTIETVPAEYCTLVPVTEESQDFNISGRITGAPSITDSAALTSEIKVSVIKEEHNYLRDIVCYADSSNEQVYQTNLHESDKKENMVGLGESIHRPYQDTIAINNMIKQDDLKPRKDDMMEETKENMEQNINKRPISEIYKHTEYACPAENCKEPQKHDKDKKQLNVNMEICVKKSLQDGNVSESGNDSVAEDPTDENKPSLVSSSHQTGEQKQLLDHREDEEQNVKPVKNVVHMFSGSQCNKDLVKHNQLSCHSQKHDKEFLHICPNSHCDETFITKEALQSHVTVHKKQPVVYTKTGCKRTFESQEMQENPLKNPVSQPPSTLCKNDENDSCLSPWASLKSHIQTHRTEGLAYHCNDCSNYFGILSTLKQHRLSHTERPPFNCCEQDCNKAFGCKENLQKHMIMHSNHNLDGTQGKYVCSFPDCSAEFSASCELEWHWLGHQQDRPSKCDYTEVVKALKR